MNLSDENLLECIFSLPKRASAIMWLRLGADTDNLCLETDPKDRSAGVAQLVEHVIRNDGVVGSSPITGTTLSLNALI